jgi:hypothetical protein
MGALETAGLENNMGEVGCWEFDAKMPTPK